VSFDFAQQFLYPLDLLSLEIGQISRQLSQRRVHSHEELTCFVVHGIGDALDLFCECFVDLPQ